MCIGARPKNQLPRPSLLGRLFDLNPALFISLLFMPTFFAPPQLGPFLFLNISRSKRPHSTTPNVPPSLLGFSNVFLWWSKWQTKRIVVESVSRCLVPWKPLPLFGLSLQSTCFVSKNFEFGPRGSHICGVVDLKANRVCCFFLESWSSSVRVTNNHLFSSVGCGKWFVSCGGCSTTRDWPQRRPKHPPPAIKSEQSAWLSNGF